MNRHQSLQPHAARDDVGIVTLQSGRLRVEIDPASGGQLRSITTEPDGKNWLFFDSSRRPASSTGLELYDDVWRGGFEELFPSDAPGRFEGRHLPDHGELWNAQFELVARDERKVVLQRDCHRVPAQFRKTVRLNPDGASFDIEYRITNRSNEALRFLFKLHPAMAIEPGDRLLLPGGSVTPVDPAFGTRFGGGAATWPIVRDREGGEFDLSLVPAPESRSQEFVYVADLAEGWCGLERARTGERLLFQFPLSVFPFCWLFLTYGGWRGYYTAVLEPCTNMPKDLSEAVRAGHCASLEPGGILECAVTVVLQPAHD